MRNRARERDEGKGLDESKAWPIGLADGTYEIIYNVLP